MGAIIEQKKDTEGEEWAIVAAWSRKLTPTQQRYSTTDREWLAAVQCITRVWKHWLLGRAFELRTDHAALREMLTKKGEEFTHRQLRWYECLEPYTFTVTYIRGHDNVVPDALSRTPQFYEMGAIELHPSSPQAMITHADFEQARLSDDKYLRVANDPELCRKLGLEVNESKALITGRGIICVPNDDALRYKLALEAHEPLYAGHFGEHKTIETLRQHWWWPQLHHTVQRVVKGCPMCQSNRTKRAKDEGPYRPIAAGAP